MSPLSTVFSLLTSSSSLLSSSSLSSSQNNIQSASSSEEEAEEEEVVLTNDAGNYSTFNSSRSSNGLNTITGNTSSSEPSFGSEINYFDDSSTNNSSLTTSAEGYADDKSFLNATTTAEFNHSTIINNATTSNFGFNNYSATTFDSRNIVGSSSNLTAFTNFGIKNTSRTIIRRRNITTIINNCTSTHVQLEYPSLEADLLDYDDFSASSSSTTEYNLEGEMEDEPTKYAPIFYLLLICVLGIYVFLYFLSRHLKAKALRLMDDEQKQKVEDRNKRGGGCRYDFEDENEMNDFGPQEQNLSVSALRFYGGRTH